MKVKDLIK